MKESVDKVYKQLQGGESFLKLEKIHSFLSDAREGKPAFKVRLQDLTVSLQTTLTNLKEGEFSKPVLTENGWDIYLLEKKQFAVSEKFTQNKDKLMLELRNKELQKLMILWLSESRKKSKIKIFSEKKG